MHRRAFLSGVAALAATSATAAPVLDAKNYGLTLEGKITPDLKAIIARSRTGLAMRATAFDQETSLAQGINVGRMFGLSWGIAAAMAALAGALLTAGSSGVETTVALVALKALPVIILGGLDSIKGSVIAGLIIGVAESLTRTYQPIYAPWLGANFDVIVPYLIMIIVLMVRPYGLFGTKEVVRV